MPNLKAFGGLDLDFLPKVSKTSSGHSRPSFEATTLVRIQFLLSYKYAEILVALPQRV